MSGINPGIQFARFAIVAFAVMLLFAITRPSFAAGRVALVIGNGAYQKVPVLPNPPQDATDVSRALERLNFRVVYLSNAGAAEMRKAVIEFGRAAEGADMAVVFYAGHGMEVGGDNWLIPIDAELRSDADIEVEAVSLKSLTLQVSKARQLGLVILDACRNNPFVAKMRLSQPTRAVNRGLAPVEPTGNVLVAFAARDGTTASDGDGKNSPFTAALLHNIETPGLEISFLFRNVRDEVMAETNREQQPFVYGSLSRDAIYLKSPVVATAPTDASPKSAAKEDEDLWSIIKSSSETRLYEEFLLRYPDSPLAERARTKLAELRSGQDAMPPTRNDDIHGKIPDSTKDDAKDDQFNSNPKERSLLPSQDLQRVIAEANARGLAMPVFAIDPMSEGRPEIYRRFVGVWITKTAFGHGRGRYGMLIVTGVSTNGSIAGYYLWGPPTAFSWGDGPAGYDAIVGSIVGDTLSFKRRNMLTEVRLDRSGSMTVQITRLLQGGEPSKAEFRSLWTLASLDSSAKSANAVGDDDAGKTRQKNSPPRPGSSEKSEPQERKMAPSIDQRCGNAHDKIGCTCAVENGGGISSDGRHWYSRHGVQSAVNDGFVACEMRYGRR